MQVEELLSRLDKVRGKHPQWAALCPAHEDKSPSLGIAIAGNGRLLMVCRAGCDIYQVCAALNIEIDELFPDRPMHRRGHALYNGQRGNQRWHDPSAMLKSLEIDLYRLAIAAQDLADGKVPTAVESIARRHCAQRIMDAARYVRGLR